MDQGKIANFNPDRNFGFIKDQSTGQDFFFHLSDSPELIKEKIKEGLDVQFEVIEYTRGLKAVKIKLL